MATTSRLIIGLLILVAGFAAGVFWSQYHTGSDHDAATLVRSLANSHSEAAPFQATSGSSREEPVGEVSPASVKSLAQTAAIRSEFDQSAALFALAAPMDAAGIRQLLESAAQVLHGNDVVGGTSILIGRYAELDFPAALAYALAHGGSTREAWIQSIFHARARLDLDDAVNIASALQSNLRRVAGMAILRSSDNIALEARRSIAKSLGLPEQALFAASGRNSAEAWREANNIGNLNQRMQAQMQIAMAWAQSDPMAALQATDDIDNQSMRTALQMQVLALIAASDSGAALAWVEALPEGQRRDQLMTSLVQRLMVEDPERAQSLITRLPETVRDQVELSMWTQRAAEDPEGAAAWAANRTDRDGSVNASHQLLMMLSMAAPEAADRFLQALPASVRTNVEPMYIQMIAASDPDKAAKRVEQITEPEQRTEAARSLIMNWASQDPQTARQWIERQPAEATPALYHSLAIGWTQKDQSSAREFADSMDAGPDHDQFVVGMVSFGQLKAEDADALIERIGDSQLREQTRSAQLQMRRAIDSSGGARFGVRIEDSGLGVVNDQ